MIEINDDIAWTPALRTRVYPSRRYPNAAYRDAQLQRVGLTHPLDPRACRDLAASYWDARTRAAALAATGLANNPPHWRATVAAALARTAQTDRQSRLDVDTEAAAVVLELCPLFAALPYWLASAGLPFALRALSRCHELTS